MKRCLWGTFRNQFSLCNQFTPNRVFCTNEQLTTNKPTTHKIKHKGPLILPHKTPKAPRSAPRSVVKEKKPETGSKPKQSHADCYITFLGTSSMKPSKTRNCQAILLTRESESFLFDCAEGTYRQFIDNSRVNTNISHIFITHLHGDHIFGLPAIILSNISPFDFFSIFIRPQIINRLT